MTFQSFAYTGGHMTIIKKLDERLTIHGEKVNRENKMHNAPGRPSTIKGKPVQVYLDASSLETAKVLGDGNISKGIRKALKAASLS